MTRPPESYALQHTVELMRTPYVVLLLDRLHHGKQPSAPPESEADAFDTAVRRLVDAGLMHPPSSTDAPQGQPGGAWFALTDKGAEVAAIVADLCRE